MKHHDRYVHDILSEIEAGHRCSQRTLASTLGIALGLANLLMRRLVRKGLVRVIRVQRNRVRYLLTPAGMAEKARMSRVFLVESLRFYAQTRDRVRQSLSELADQWPPRAGRNSLEKRIVFYGMGEVAEIAYICLQETDLKLVGVVGDVDRRVFFQLPVHATEDITGERVGDTPFDHIVVTSFENRETIRQRLERQGVRPDRVHWL